VSEVKAPPQRWLILGVLVLTFMCSFAYAFAVTQPSVGILSEVFGLDPGTVGGLMMLALSIAAAVMSIPAGILTDKWGVKKTGILAVALLLIGWLISGIATDFTLVLVGRALIGLGGVTISIVGPPALLGWFPPTEIGTAMGVWSVAMPLGLAWEIPFATWVMLNYGWQSAYLIGAVFSLVFLGLYALLIRPGPLLAPPPKPEAGAQPPKMSEALANPEVWKFSLSVLFTIMVFQSINAFFQIWTGTRLAEEAGMAMSDAFALAGSIAGFIGLTGIFGVLISGILSDKLGRQEKAYIHTCSLTTDNTTTNDSLHTRKLWNLCSHSSTNGPVHVLNTTADVRHTNTHCQTRSRGIIARNSDYVLLHCRHHRAYDRWRHGLDRRHIVPSSMLFDWCWARCNSKV